MRCAIPPRTTRRAGYFNDIDPDFQELFLEERAERQKREEERRARRERKAKRKYTPWENDEYDDWAEDLEREFRAR